MNAKRIITQYYVLTAMFALGAMFTTSTYVTFLAEKGLNLFQINLANAVFFTTLFVCEIPTGAFADIFGRKRSFVLACFILGLAGFTYGSSHTFWGFACAEALAAVSSTFRNGAFEAWLVDSLKHDGHAGDLSKIFGRANLCRQGVGAGASIAGAYLGSYRPELPWFICGAFAAVTGVIAQMAMREAYFVHQKFSWKRGLQSMKDVAMSSLRYGSANKAVRFILAITFIQILAVQAFNMYWQPFFGARGVQKENFGYIFAAILAAIASGSYLVTRLDTQGKEKQFIIRTQICVGMAAGLAATLTGLPLVLGFFLIHEVGRGFWQPVKDSYLHQRIPSHERATIASFCSIAPHIGGAIGLVGSGAIAEYAGIRTSWILSAGIFIVGAMLVSRNGDHKKIDP